MVWLGMFRDAEERERFRLRSMDESEREKVLAKIKEVLERDEDVILAVVHGSFIKEKLFRDVDVAVYARGSVDYLNLKFRLDSSLSEAVKLPVDVKVLNDAPLWFIRRALREGRLIVEKHPIYEKLLLMSLEKPPSA